MQVEATLKLKDSPGTLIGALAPISSHGGNIISIAHRRQMKEGDYVPTTVYFEVTDMEHLDEIRRELAARKIKLVGMKIEGRRLVRKRSFLVLLIGHVMNTDAKDTIDRLSESGAHVSDFGVSITSLEMPSSAILRVDVDDRNYKKTLKKLEDIARRKNLLVVKEV